MSTTEQTEGAHEERTFWRFSSADRHIDYVTALGHDILSIGVRRHLFGLLKSYHIETMTPKRSTREAMRKDALAALHDAPIPAYVYPPSHVHTDSGATSYTVKDNPIPFGESRAHAHPHMHSWPLR